MLTSILKKSEPPQESFERSQRYVDKNCFHLIIGMRLGMNWFGENILNFFFSFIHHQKRSYQFTVRTDELVGSILKPWSSRPITASPGGRYGCLSDLSQFPLQPVHAHTYKLEGNSCQAARLQGLHKILRGLGDRL